MKPEDKKFATPRTVKLRDGRSITIRLLDAQDAEGYVPFYTGIPEEDNIFYIGPDATTAEKARERVINFADNPYEVCLVLADEEGGIHGEAWFRWSENDTEKSCFGICLARSMQGSGAGRLIMSRLMEIGDLYGPPVMTLTAQVDNFRAWKLYTSEGFVILKKQMRAARKNCPEMVEFYMERQMGRRCVAGAAHRTISPEIGSHIPGQLHVRIVDHVRDALEVNLLILKNRETELCLVTLDNAGIFSAEDCARMRGIVHTHTGVPAENVIIASSHTHAGGMAQWLLHDSPTDHKYLGLIDTQLADVAREAVASLQPALVGCATGHAHVGYNRRLCFADGSHTMYGDSTRKDFTGIEGPDDPTHTVLAVFDEQKKPMAICYNNCSHSTTVESDIFISSDFCGEARRLIREALACELPVLYLQGASGDTSPWNQLTQPTRYSGVQRLHEMGALLAAETLRLLPGMTPQADPVLNVVFSEPVMNVRLPSEEDVEKARETKAKGEAVVGRWEYVIGVCGELRLWEDFHANPTQPVPLWGVRIGDLAIATVPFELYCQFGLDIRRRSPAKHTMICQLTGEFIGYVPTIYGILGGGYSGKPIYWARMEPYAGYRAVDESARLLGSLFR